MLGYGKNPVDNINMALNGVERDYDIGTINDNPFVYVVGMGKLMDIPYETKSENKKKCGYKSASQKMYKPVLQFDKEGKFIKEYESIDSAIKETGVLHVSCVCRGERKTAGGYIWKYK